MMELLLWLLTGTSVILSHIANHVVIVVTRKSVVWIRRMVPTTQTGIVRIVVVMVMVMVMVAMMAATSTVMRRRLRATAVVVRHVNPRQRGGKGRETKVLGGRHTRIMGIDGMMILIIIIIIIVGRVILR